MDGNNPTQVTNPTAEGGTPTVQTPTTQTPAVDTSTANNPFTQEQLDQIVSAINSAQETKAKAVVKSFGNQNGMELSKEDVAQVIAEINKQKKAQEPDVTTLTDELNTYKTNNRNKDIQITALLMKDELGVDNDTINNVLLKFADTSKAINEDDTVNAEELKNAFTTFLESYPAFKKQAPAPQNTNTNGFKPKVGVEPTADTGKAAEDITRARFGLKPKTN
jgi:hypothetical protein